jgi:hypothetical protein
LPRFGPRSNIASCDCPAVAANCSRRLTACCRSRPIGLRYFFFSFNSTGPNFPRPNIYVLRVHGGRGRIRTSVARKERQIYSLLVLATHPPVLEIYASRQVQVQQTFVRKRSRQQTKTQNGLVSEDTSPSILSLRIRSASFPRKLTGGAGGGN